MRLLPSWRSIRWLDFSPDDRIAGSGEVDSQAAQVSHCREFFVTETETGLSNAGRMESAHLLCEPLEQP
jgi:hypothetical protein